jgi:hypothetical protein
VQSELVLQRLLGAGPAYAGGEDQMVERVDLPLLGGPLDGRDIDVEVDNDGVPPARLAQTWLWLAYGSELLDHALAGRYELESVAGTRATVDLRLDRRPFLTITPPHGRPAAPGRQATSMPARWYRPHRVTGRNPLTGRGVRWAAQRGSGRPITPCMVGGQLLVSGETAENGRRAVVARAG